MGSALGLRGHVLILGRRRQVVRRRAVGWLMLVARACVALLATGCAILQAGPEDSGLGDPRQARAGQVIVTLAPAPPATWAAVTEALAFTYGLARVGVFPLESLGVQCVVFQVLEDGPVGPVIPRLASDPRVESVQVNQLFHSLDDLRSDPYARLQYGAGAIRADLAHRWVTGKGVKVAVVDTGLDTEHPDLRDRIVQTANFVDGGESTFQQDRHGTAVAGVIAASVDNRVGIVGIAPEADLIGLKACWHRGGGSRPALCSSWTLARAVDFSSLVGAQVLNLSLAGPSDPLLARLIRRAMDRGVTVIAAMTDEGRHAPGFPASLSGVIGVIASDPHGHVRRGGAAKRGPALAAPGVDILTTAPGQAYDFMSGSSLAAAHVSGVVALLLERHPRLTPAQVHSLLFTTARPVEGLNGGAPALARLVDACAAIARPEDVERCP
jgi:subtilisin family serine protease